MSRRSRMRRRDLLNLHDELRPGDIARFLHWYATELVIIPEDVSGIMVIVGCYPGLSSNLTKYGSNRDNSYPGSYSPVSPLLGGGNDTLFPISDFFVLPLVAFQLSLHQTLPDPFIFAS